MEIDPVITPEKKPPQQKHNDVVAIELPAPSGWTKKFTPKRRRNEIVFISPNGEEIRSKRQLEQYLKSHPEAPSASEFDWGTGDTPRRSARLSEKSKATESPGSETPKKKQKSSSSKKGRKKKNDADEEGETADEDEEIKESAEVSMKDAEDAAKHGDGEAVTGEVFSDKDITKDTEQKTDAGEAVAGEVFPDKVITKDSEQKTGVGEMVTEESGPDKDKDTNLNEEDAVETDMDQGENQEAGNYPPDGKGEAAESKELPSIGPADSNKKAESAPCEPEAALHLPKSNDTPPVQELDAVEDSTSKVAGANVEEPTEKVAGGEVELMDQPKKEASAEKVESVEAGAASGDISMKDEAEKPKENHSLMEEASAGNHGTTSS